MSCPKCGSWAVKADRSLGGRMVCGRCGEPLGAKVIPLRRSGRRARWRPPGQGLGVWWLALILLLGVSGVLAALQISGERQRPLPRDRSDVERPQRLFGAPLA